MDLIEQDLDLVLDLMKDQIEKQQYKDFFITINHEIIDVFAFKSYIETTTITNFGRIKNLIKKADEIIAIYNENLYGGSILGEKQYEPIAIKTTSIILLSNHPIDCIIINDGHSPKYVTPAGYESFFSNNPEQYTNYQFAVKCMNLMTAIEEAFSNDFPMRYYRQKSTINDPHTIEWSLDNSIKFGKDKIYFPFDCHQLAKSIMRLRIILLDRSMLITELQGFPPQIFQDSGLQFHPNLSAWVYNILETWIKDLIKDFQKSKSDILTDFLNQCNALAIASKIIDESANLPEIKEDIVHDFQPSLSNIENAEKITEFDFDQTEVTLRNTDFEKPNVLKIAPHTFKEIFKIDDYKKYISVFEITKPALLDANWNFIGKPKKHKGVICNWIRDLQFGSKIGLEFTRGEIAHVLNNEIKNFNLGKDGKTIHNNSKEYTTNFKSQLENLIK